MSSSPGWKRLIGFAGLMLAGLEASGANEPPVTLPAVTVVESLIKVSVSTTYYRFPIGVPAATAMMVREVRVPSFAYDAGLRKGMEIMAIDGQRIAGLSQGEVERLLSSPKKDEVVLRVRGGGKKKPEDLHISLKVPKEPAAQSTPREGDTANQSK